MGGHASVKNSFHLVCPTRFAVRFYKEEGQACVSAATNPCPVASAVMTSLLSKSSVNNCGACRGPQSKHIMQDATQYVGNNAPADKLKAIKLRMFAARDLSTETWLFNCTISRHTQTGCPPTPLSNGGLLCTHPLVIVITVTANAVAVQRRKIKRRICVQIIMKIEQNKCRR